MKNFEMAETGDTRGIIGATQRSLISAIKDLVSDLKKETKAPGLTWDQLDYLLEGFRNKEVTLIEQEHEV